MLDTGTAFALTDKAVAGGKLFLASASYRPKLGTRPIPASHQVVSGKSPNTSDAATMNAAIEEQYSPESKDVCTIVVLYDGDVTRARALEACDYLVNQFWQDVELEFHWWRTDFLRDEMLASVAATNGVAADFLIVCLDSNREIAPALESWFESWLMKRSGREGALVDLTRAQKPGTELTQRELFLREVSVRGNFDYLTAIPDEGRTSLASGNPSGEMSGVIDDILGESRPPSHFGLNE
ncbi:MAG: hypothetical protein D4R57_00180 [Verrucomicrobiales bacterium]|nr:MAG: hypothetical protein D4R57_00180 [Verrucomicrobiales bacterium]